MASKYALIFALVHYLFLEGHSVGFLEHFISVDRYCWIFSRQWRLFFICAADNTYQEEIEQLS